MADLAPLGSDSIEVRTKANPSSASLMAARAAIQRSSLLKDIFRWSREESWDRQRLIDAIVPILASTLAAEETDVAQAAEYLSDEYAQIGDAVLIVSRLTGRAIARVTEQDMWQPAPVPRESGNMVKPLPRLRPEIEGFLVQWSFNQARDQKIHAEMSLRTEQTPILVAEGDPRLLSVTSRGRRLLSDEIRRMLPEILLSHTQGAAANFIRRFDVRMDEPSDTSRLCSSLRCTARASIRVPVQDPTTFNLRYDRLGAMAASIGQEWVRGVAFEVASLAYSGPPVDPTLADNLTSAQVDPSLLWVAGPDESIAIRRAEPLATCFVVDGADPVGVAENAGVIVLDPDSYRSESREVHDRWEVVATFEYTVMVDPERVRRLPLEGVTRTVVVV